jgi:hypothetical protein
MIAINGAYHEAGTLTCATKSEVYDDDGRQWSLNGWNLPERHKGCSVKGANDKIYMMGGLKCSTGEILNTLDILDLTSGSVTHGPNMAFPRYSFSCFLYQKEEDEFLLVVGGITNDTTGSVGISETLNIHQGKKKPP